MAILLTFLIGSISIVSGYFLFKKWFNHLTIYSLVWMSIIILYEMKLIRFIDLSTKTWLVITGSFAAFVLGILAVYTGREIWGNNRIFSKQHSKSALFLDSGKKIKFFLILFSIIGLFSSLQHWYVLINHYGSITNVILHAMEIYRSRIYGDEIEGIIPYIWWSSYFGVFLGGLYSGYKGRVTLLSTIPFISVVLQETARFTRSGILFGLLEFVICFMLYRHFQSNSQDKKPVSKLVIIVTSVIVIFIGIAGATVVKVIRNPVDNFQGSTSTINQFKTGSVISPSVYFYAASQIGVLNVYLRDENEDISFGNSTFFTFYNILSKFDIVQKPKVFQKGYFIPMWSNTATYLRDLNADYGFIGPIIFPFLIGLLTTFFWFRFYERRKFIYYVVLTYLFILIAISFFTLATRYTPWIYGLLLFSILIPQIEKINVIRYGR